MRDQPTEADTDKAAAILGGISRRSIEAIEPIHWVAEVVGVVTRIKPDRAMATIALLTHPRFSVIASRAVYRRAAQLPITLNHHLFDTLYQTVALEEGSAAARFPDTMGASSRGHPSACAPFACAPLPPHLCCC
jgi:hypothetical protein